MKQELLKIDDIRAVEDESEAAGLTKGMLMDRAGAEIAELAYDVSEEGLIVVLCGTGNNGGDGWVAARLLYEMDCDVEVLCTRAPEDLKPGIARDAAIRAAEAGVTWTVNPTEEQLLEALMPCTLVIDAIFGAGFHGVVGAPYDLWIDYVKAVDVPVIAVDVPTGLAGDEGTAEGPCLPADWTLATIAGKLGMVGGFGGEVSGEVYVSDLGIEEILPGRIARDEAAQLWDEEEYASLMPYPGADANKYSRGYVLVIGGSTDYPGAAIMAAQAAARCGSGYVRLCVPEPVVPICQMHLLSTPVSGFPAADGAFAGSAAVPLLSCATRADAVVLGPGITDTAGTREVVSALIGHLECPLLIDADALGIVAHLADELKARAAAGHATVLTPHEGEMARLLAGIGREDALTRPSTPIMRVDAAKLLAAELGVVCALKGPGTVIADGERCVQNGSGCVALATSGTGDVLSGIIGGLLSRKMDAFEAAALGVHIHGLAGEFAAFDMDEFCVVAEDVIDCIPDAVSLLSDEEDFDE